MSRTFTTFFEDLRAVIQYIRAHHRSITSECISRARGSRRRFRFGRYWWSLCLFKSPASTRDFIWILRILSFVAQFTDKDCGDEIGIWGNDAHAHSRTHVSWQGRLFTSKHLSRFYFLKFDRFARFSSRFHQSFIRLKISIKSPALGDICAA